MADRVAEALLALTQERNQLERKLRWSRRFCSLVQPTHLASMEESELEQIRAYGESLGAHLARNSRTTAELAEKIGWHAQDVRDVTQGRLPPFTEELTRVICIWLGLSRTQTQRLLDAADTANRLVFGDDLSTDTLGAEVARRLEEAEKPVRQMVAAEKRYQRVRKLCRANMDCECSNALAERDKAITALVESRE